MRIARFARHALVRGALQPSLDVIPRLTRGLPHDVRRRKGMRIDEDVAYGPDPAHRLDVFRRSDLIGPRPALIYVHGGGFVSCSKRTHINIALAFARRGFVVFNLDYRLAPGAPFPAALEDVTRAIHFVSQRGKDYGAASARAAVWAGESAGANLVLAAATGAAAEARAHGLAALRAELPQALLLGCGLLQVSDTARFARADPSLGKVAAGTLRAVEEAYLGRGGSDYADPLLVLERARESLALPPSFVFCGEADPVLADSLRLSAALARHGSGHETALYPGEPHAFFAATSRPAAREAWAAMDAFLRARGVEVTSDPSLDQRA